MARSRNGKTEEPGDARRKAAWTISATGRRAGPRHLAAGLLLTFAAGGHAADLWDRVEHRYADNDGVRIHYAILGEGEPVVFVHGFPDFWYSWRHQMETLAPHFKTVAIDTRGYNLSDKPEDVDDYRLPHLLADVTAVIDDLGAEQVTLVGHDWGGAIAWRYTMENQDRVKRLVILNLTHPKGYAAVVANASPEQAANVQYARDFATSEPTGGPPPDWLLGMGERSGDPAVAARYRAAFEQSSFDGMMNYYRANYGNLSESGNADMPDITSPVLQFHGLEDTAIDRDGLRDTWNWVTSDYTLVTIPGAGHFVQWDAAELVSETMKWWLLARE
jgi:pimeloyl-ACP methyl ester carboxylesterase